MVYEGEQEGAEVVARKLIGQAVSKVFREHFPEPGKESKEIETEGAHDIRTPASSPGSPPATRSTSRTRCRSPTTRRS